MVKKLLIKNNTICHYEIIESVIVKYYDILKIDKNTPVDIYLYIIYNLHFIKYITNKYPNIILNNLKKYDYCINCTIYDKDYNNLDKHLSNNKYISHDISNRLKKNPNVFFLTPLSDNNYIYTDILPYSECKIKNNIPIYIIQGNINKGRRNYNLLINILNNNYKYNFIIKIIGRGNLPLELQKYKDKILLKNNLNFIDFHKEFLDAYCIIPLISKNTHPKYYKSKLTSSINYARGYKLKCLIDIDLQNIYNLNDVEIYNDDISIGFSKTLEYFYKTN